MVRNQVNKLFGKIQNMSNIIFTDKDSRLLHTMHLQKKKMNSFTGLSDARA